MSAHPWDVLSNALWAADHPTRNATRAISALTSAGLAILPADMTEAQAARSLAGSGLAQRLRVSSPETYAEMVERRRATWREMVAVMGEGSDDR